MPAQYIVTRARRKKLKERRGDFIASSAVQLCLTKSSQLRHMAHSLLETPGPVWLAGVTDNVPIYTFVTYFSCLTCGHCVTCKQYTFMYFLRTSLQKKVWLWKTCKNNLFVFMKLKSVQYISCSRVNYDPDMPPHQRTNCNIAREVIPHGLARQPAR